MFALKVILPIENLSFFFKDSNQGFGETQSGPIPRSCFAHRAPLVSYAWNNYGVSQNHLAASSGSGHPWGYVWESLGPCWDRQPGTLRPSVLVQARCLPRLLHLFVLWPSRHVSGSMLVFAPSQSDALLLRALSSSSTPRLSHKHTRIKTHFSQASADLSRPTFIFWGYVYSSLIQGHMRSGSKRTRSLLSTFDF